MKLTPAVAQIFQRFADMALYSGPEHRPALITNPFPDPGNNGLEPVGLSHADLVVLAENGLIRYGMETSDFSARDLQGRFHLGGVAVKLVGHPARIDRKIALLFLRGTQAGSEISSIMELG